MIGANPYKNIPTEVFVIRLLPLMAMGLMVGLFVVGIFSTAPAFNAIHEWNAVLRTLPPSETGAHIMLEPREYEIGGVLTGAFQHYGRLMTYATDFPTFCLDDAVNSLIEKRCDEYLNKLGGEVFLGLSPLLWVSFLFFLGWTFLTRFYREAAKTLDGKKPQFEGMVTDPPLYPSDLVCQIFRLKAISLQRADGTQIPVYFPAAVMHPGPGQKMAVYRGPEVLGRSRYVGVLYAPHIAVVRGS